MREEGVNQLEEEKWGRQCTKWGRKWRFRWKQEERKRSSGLGMFQVNSSILLSKSYIEKVSWKIAKEWAKITEGLWRAGVEMRKEGFPRKEKEWNWVVSLVTEPCRNGKGEIKQRESDRKMGSFVICSLTNDFTLQSLLLILTWLIILAPRSHSNSLSFSMVFPISWSYLNKIQS